ncbi:unnamed protein product [Closterium sp. NIES-64]|nr:unnamed protein product [Closterium sp. NIES-64]CAI6003326.1 unnamed protein product [Closterium sp. NIES-64]
MLGSEAAIGAEGRGGLSRGLSRGYVAGSRPHQRLILGSEDEMLTLASHNFDAAFFPSLLIVSAIASTLLAVAFAVAPLFEFTDFSTPVVLGVVTAIHLDFALLLLTIIPILSSSFSRPFFSPPSSSVSRPASSSPLQTLPCLFFHLQSAPIGLSPNPIAPPSFSLDVPPSAPPLLPRLSRPQLRPPGGPLLPRCTLPPHTPSHSPPSVSCPFSSANLPALPPPVPVPSAPAECSYRCQCRLHRPSSPLSP